MTTRNSRVRYDVFGPFEVLRKPSKRGKSSLDFSRRSLTSFSESVEHAVKDLRNGTGCYLFAVRAARGIKPWYVGQSKGPFENECFALHKQAIYREAMDDIASGTPVLFLIARRTTTGKLSRRVAEAEARFVEQRLIDDANKANPQLKNSHNTRFVRNLEIPGVMNSPRGQPSDAVQALKVALGK